MSLFFKNMITKFKEKYANTKERSYEYLHSYTEFRYMQILSSMHTLVKYFNEKSSRSQNAVQCIQKSISHITKMDHVKISYTHTNNYHVNTGLVHPQMQLIDTTHLIAGSFTDDERTNFLRCIQPVINEKALEPPQLTLFQSLYQMDNFRKKIPSQFVGQFLSTHNSIPFQSFETALLDMT